MSWREHPFYGAPSKLPMSLPAGTRSRGGYYVAKTVPVLRPCLPQNYFAVWGPINRLGNGRISSLDASTIDRSTAR